MSVLEIVKKVLFFVWFLLKWLCGVQRRHVHVEGAQGSVGGGERPPSSVDAQNPPELRRRNVTMVSTGGVGASDSPSMNLTLGSPQYMSTPITQGQVLQQTYPNTERGSQTVRPTAPVLEGVESGLSGARYAPTPLDLFPQGWSPNMASPYVVGRQESGALPSGAPNYHTEPSSEVFYSLPTGNISNFKSNPSRLKFKPEKFDGTADWSDYLKHFEAVAQWNTWTPEEKAVQLSMNLTGVARQVWSDCMDSVVNGQDYQALVKAMG